jgi:hypothetical protein
MFNLTGIAVIPRRPADRGHLRHRRLSTNLWTIGPTRGVLPGDRRLGPARSRALRPAPSAVTSWAGRVWLSCMPSRRAQNSRPGAGPRRVTAGHQHERQDVVDRDPTGPDIGALGAGVGAPPVLLAAEGAPDPGDRAAQPTGAYRCTGSGPGSGPDPKGTGAPWLRWRL